jgi:hypothetical protein
MSPIDSVLGAGNGTGSVDQVPRLAGVERANDRRFIAGKPTDCSGG